MSEPAYRIPVAPEYAKALGHAVYSFCYLEWGVVWIIQCLEPGYIHDIQGFTAGKFAKHLTGRVKAPASLETNLRARLEKFAAQFTDLVKDRNALVHGNPFTADGGEQRLGYSGRKGRVDWTLSDIINLTRRFEAASIEAGDLLRGHLLKK
jgi:hypothetical protein